MDGDKKTVVIFSGAGLSAESGIPTFRDSDGLWENHKIEDVADPKGWSKDRELVLKFYQDRYKNIMACEPNEAHKSIARLQEKYNVVNITQNIDDLLERAGCETVHHVHGSIMRRCCEFHEEKWPKGGDCFGYECTYRDTHDRPVQLGDICPRCCGQLRPDVVWFGEPVDLKHNWIKVLLSEVKYNDGVFITVGTSARVHPAAYLIPFFSQVPNKYIINKVEQRISDYQERIGSASVEMYKLAEELLGKELSSCPNES